MTGTSDELLLRKMAQGHRVEFKSAAEIALAVSSGRADAFTTTVLELDGRKKAKNRASATVNPTPRVAVGHIGLRLRRTSAGRNSSIAGPSGTSCWVTTRLA